VQALALFFASFLILLGAIYVAENFHTTSQFDEYTSEAMYVTFFSGNHTGVFVFKDLNFPRKFAVVSSLVVDLFQVFQIACADILTLLSAVAIYDVTNRLHGIIFSKVDLNLQFLLTGYEQMCMEVNGINEINSKVMLVVYVRLLSWLSHSSVDVLEPSNWLIKVHLLIYYIFYSSIFILAEEANRQVSLQLKISDFFPS